MISRGFAVCVNRVFALYVCVFKEFKIISLDHDKNVYMYKLYVIRIRQAAIMKSALVHVDEMYFVHYLLLVNYTSYCIY